ncbi:CLUMA_CG006517, isoform A [Clunio marinus]|uniref:Galectin n=1 Tax=Clunio marinus TaxID=568069 RepID=A0A1J1HY94_9DIPT|nr:CLUMA_CG006517, isoform A [Clunio marinus]
MATIPIYNPIVPFLGAIPGGLRPGHIIKIKGRINGYDSRLMLDLINTPAINVNQDIIFHISVRPQESAIIRNHFSYGSWGHEERDGPFARAFETFEMTITVENDCYRLALNGIEIGAFLHRLPLQLSQFIHVHGDATIDHILLENGYHHSSGIHMGTHQISTPSAPNMPMPIQTPYPPGSQFPHHNTSHFPIHQPPYYPNQQPPDANWRHIAGGFRPSFMIRIKGKINGYNGRCMIDFTNSLGIQSGQDIMFHISIRPKDFLIVRNHFQNGNWGNEEKYGPCRVKKNQTFEIVILAEIQHYKIAINGHHLGVFRHRLPLHLVQCIQVYGEVSIDHILLEQDLRSAQQQMVLSQVLTPRPVTVPVNAPVYVQYQPPHQHQTPPPPYYGNHPNSSITRIGGITIETNPGRIVVRKGHNQSNIFRF